MGIKTTPQYEQTGQAGRKGGSKSGSKWGALAGALIGGGAAAAATTATGGAAALPIAGGALGGVGAGSFLGGLAGEEVVGKARADTRQAIQRRVADMGSDQQPQGQSVQLLESLRALKQIGDQQVTQSYAPQLISALGKTSTGGA